MICWRTPLIALCAERATGKSESAAPRRSRLARLRAPVESLQALPQAGGPPVKPSVSPPTVAAELRRKADRLEGAEREHLLWLAREWEEIARREGRRLPARPRADAVSAVGGRGF